MEVWNEIAIAKVKKRKICNKSSSFIAIHFPLFLSPFNLVFQKSIDKKEKMTPLLFTLLALEMGLIIILLFHSPIRNLVVTGLDRLKQGRGLVASRTLTTILSVVFVFNLYGIYKNQKHMMEVGVTNPTDRVLLSNHILEASLMGFCLFLGLMIDRLHYYVKELWLLRKSLKAIRNQIGDSDLIQPINKNKKI
ncbi:uncharacterized protein LOC111889685 [Lactuca sativa]|uniref:Endoplasmic reticulum transmembrane protein n=1 Tax=Lactuca sativa TaxID=4236 RepID=A0A9R1WRX3_LACSA|nr:uncharacterized protein LOC111889685 [Lactuca sativa]KAJ0185034.1 hypothetical protein LSAT_V11C900493230 [Lactuca sativa]